MRADNARFQTRLDGDDHLTHLLFIPPTVPELLKMEGRTPVVQLDETFRTSVHGVGRFHVITTTNNNQTFTLAYCFMRTAKKEDLTRILQAILDFGLILEPEAIVTEA